MKTVFRWLGLFLLAGVGLFLIWFGLLYANVMGLLWFHAAAIPEAVMEEIRPLYFALMRLIGGASVGLGVLGLYVTFGPVRMGNRLAVLALAGANIIVFGVAGYTAEKLAADTGAPTSWTIMGILAGATIAGALLTEVSARQSAQCPRGNR